MNGITDFINIFHKKEITIGNGKLIKQENECFKFIKDNKEFVVIIRLLVQNSFDYISNKERNLKFINLFNENKYGIVLNYIDFGKYKIDIANFNDVYKRLVEELNSITNDITIIFRYNAEYDLLVIDFIRYEGESQDNFGNSIIKYFYCSTPFVYMFSKDNSNWIHKVTKMLENDINMFGKIKFESTDRFKNIHPEYWI